MTLYEKMSGNSLSMSPSFMGKSGLLYCVPFEGKMYYVWICHSTKRGEVNMHRVGWSDGLRGLPAASCQILEFACRQKQQASQSLSLLGVFWYKALHIISGVWVGTAGRRYCPNLLSLFEEISLERRSKLWNCQLAPEWRESQICSPTWS